MCAPTETKAKKTQAPPGERRVRRFHVTRWWMDAVSVCRHTCVHTCGNGVREIDGGRGGSYRSRLQGGNPRVCSCVDARRVGNGCSPSCTPRCRSRVVRRRSPHVVQNNHIYRLPVASWRLRCLLVGVIACGESTEGQLGPVLMGLHSHLSHSPAPVAAGLSVLPAPPHATRGVALY